MPVFYFRLAGFRWRRCGGIIPIKVSVLRSRTQALWDLAALLVKNAVVTSRFNPLCLFFRGAVDREGTMGLQGHREPG